MATTTATNIASYTIEGENVWATKSPEIFERPKPKPAPVPAKPAPKPVPAPPVAPAPGTDLIECGHCHNMIKSQPIHSELRDGRMTLIYLCETCNQRVSVEG